VEALFPEAFCPVLKEPPGFTVILWMFGQDVSFDSFVGFVRLITKHLPTQNTVWVLLVIPQSLYERDKVIAVYAFHDD
jgi:hypothetical protein